MNSFLSYQPSGAQKYTSPNSVPKQQVIQIYSDDPRNNELYLQTCGLNIIVVERDEDVDNDDEDVENFYLNESVDPESTLDLDPYLGPLQYSDIFSETQNQYILSVPTNLQVDTDSFRLETNSSDGSVKWVTSLYFDDVDGATGYEYEVVAS